MTVSNFVVSDDGRYLTFMGHTYNIPGDWYGENGNYKMDLQTLIITKI